MIIKSFLQDASPEMLETLGRASGSGLVGVIAGIGTTTMIKNRKLFSTNQRSMVNLFTNITVTMYTMYRYYFGNYFPKVPTAVIAGIPLGTVDELSWAISDLDLKYRANRGIFLAHQDPGDQTLRIICKAYGDNRFWLLTVIELLKLWGSAKRVDQFKDILTGGATVKPLSIAGVSADPWTEFDAYALDQGIEEQHLTFPVITTKRIFSSMYIETYDFTEGIEYGMNCLTFTIFFRKYSPKYHLKYALEIPADESRKKPILYYAEDDTSEDIEKLKGVDLFLEIGFSLAMIFYRTFMILAGNTNEKNIALSFGLGLNESYFGANKFEDTLKERTEGISETDSLSGLSTENIEELFQID